MAAEIVTADMEGRGQLCYGRIILAFSMLTEGLMP